MFSVNIVSTKHKHGDEKSNDKDKDKSDDTNNEDLVILISTD